MHRFFRCNLALSAVFAASARAINSLFCIAFAQTIGNGLWSPENSHFYYVELHEPLSCPKTLDSCMYTGSQPDMLQKIPDGFSSDSWSAREFFSMSFDYSPYWTSLAWTLPDNMLSTTPFPIHCARLFFRPCALLESSRSPLLPTKAFASIRLQRSSA